MLVLKSNLLSYAYYRIYSNSHTLVILLQVDLAFGDELEIVCEGFYKIENIFIFAWFSILNVGHYCWLSGPICRLLPNSKVDYLVCTIQRIPDFLAVMNYHYGIAQDSTCHCMTCSQLLEGLKCESQIENKKK
jgi:hypothetical protein